MPNTKSYKKTMKTDAKRRLRNRMTRTMLKTLIKNLRTVAKTGDQAATQEAYRLVVKRLDQAASKHRIHKNKAARLKSRLSVLLKPAAG